MQPRTCPGPFDNAQDRPVEGAVPSGAEGLTHHRWVSLRSTHPTIHVHSNAEWNYKGA
ncbi:protein of unknown function [Methylocaldum szegediense]|uniref:Uncharacterized protein n=1 Tax=Methylocaldum szegediense TaxID=73780 RepID=A0ABN8X1P8_9GAMM|nr:protein of unknown function [Methylocaldum szegediense]